MSSSVGEVIFIQQFFTGVFGCVSFPFIVLYILYIGCFYFLSFVFYFFNFILQRGKLRGIFFFAILLGL